MYNMVNTEKDSKKNMVIAYAKGGAKPTTLYLPAIIGIVGSLAFNGYPVQSGYVGYYGAMDRDLKVQ